MGLTFQGFPEIVHCLHQTSLLQHYEAEVVVDFHDQLRNVTAGFGSLDSSEGDPPLREANVAKVEIMLNGDVVEPLAFVCHKDDAQSQGRVVCKSLQAVLPRQQFVTVIQAKADGR